MPRKPRIVEPGCYHIINRGVERRNTFLDGDDFDKFLSIFAETKDLFDIVAHSFCLMSNHYHILLETKDSNISDAIKFLNSNYSIYFNKRYGRTGHLWQGRFQSYFIFDDFHFWIVAKYIERNPLKANIVKKLEHYKYQSYFQIKYKNTFLSLLNGSKIYDMEFDEYEKFISTDLDEDSLLRVFQTPKVVSTDENNIIPLDEVALFFDKDVDFNRNTNIKKAFNAGHGIGAIANFLHLDRKTVSKIIHTK